MGASRPQTKPVSPLLPAEAVLERAEKLHWPAKSWAVQVAVVAAAAAARAGAQPRRAMLHDKLASCVVVGRLKSLLREHGRSSKTLTTAHVLLARFST